MASTFLKDNFASMKKSFKGNLTDEEKEKLKANSEKAFNKLRKGILGVAAGDKEIAFLSSMLEEDK